MLSPCSIVTMFALRSIHKSKTKPEMQSRIDILETQAALATMHRTKTYKTKHTPHTTRKVSNTYLIKFRG